MMTQLGVPLVIATFCRFLLKTGRRIVYPFITVFSVALGVSVLAVTALLAVNQVAGLLSPCFGPCSDRWGYRTMMVIGLALASVCMVAVMLLPTYTVLLVALFAVGVGISICDPALQAYIGAQIPFAQRGQAIGLIELTWAASSLIGIPVAGLLINRYHWSTPFGVMGLLGLVGTILLWRLLPAETLQRVPRQPVAWRQMWGNLLRRPAAQGLLVYALLVSCASDVFFVIYGLWLADTFGLGIVALGLAATVIGLAELSGELLTAAVADRLQLRRVLPISLLVTAACFLLLPVWSFSLWGALVGFFLLFLAFEFNLVVTLSVSTEVVPTARATMMSGFQAASGLGHVLGALTGGLIWFHGGISGVSLVTAALCGLALVAVQWGLRTFRQPASSAAISQQTPALVYAHGDGSAHHHAA